jgi:hypothetical protein
MGRTPNTMPGVPGTTTGLWLGKTGGNTPMPGVPGTTTGLVMGWGGMNGVPVGSTTAGPPPFPKFILQELEDALSKKTL